MRHYKFDTTKKLMVNEEETTFAITERRFGKTTVECSYDDDGYAATYDIEFKNDMIIIEDDVIFVHGNHNPRNFENIRHILEQVDIETDIEREIRKNQG